MPHRLASATPLLLALGIACAPMPARSEAAAPADQWQWAATVYVWLPSIGSETSFPPGDGGPSIDVFGEDILDNLNFAFMGTVQGRKGAWGLATDVIYLDLDATKNGTRDFQIGHVGLPASVTGDLDLGVTGWLWTLAGDYALVDQDAFSLHALAGVRFLSLEETLDWSLDGDLSSLPTLDRSGSARDEEDVWDAIVGVKGRAALGAARKWYVPYYLDVGAGESDLTWQAMLGLGYSFDTIDVTGVWRYLDYDLGNATPIKSIDFNGPAIGVTFRF